MTQGESEAVGKSLGDIGFAQTGNQDLRVSKGCDYQYTFWKITLLEFLETGDFWFRWGDTETEGSLYL